MLKSFSFARIAVVIAAVAAASSVISGTRADAQTASDPQVRKAIKYLDDAKHAKDVFGVLHFGSTMGQYEVKTLHSVTDRSGRTVPGEFAIKVVYDWDTAFGANVTTAMFYFNKDGYVTDIDAKSTSIISTPFDIANATMQIVGELLVSLAKEGGATQKELDQMRQLVTNADSRGLMMLSMNVQLLAGL